MATWTEPNPNTDQEVKPQGFGHSEPDGFGHTPFGHVWEGLTSEDSDIPSQPK